MPSETTAPDSSSWYDRASRRLGELAERPFLLLLVLLAANALARPYANIIHDARLYAAQVLNQLGNGSLANDLFFRYGSQDQYSLFSFFLAPLVRVLGLEAAFFIVYLASTTVLLYAMIRLVNRLVDDRALAVLALIYLAVAPLTYGGQGCLHVHEPFLTPRLLAAGPVLLGLDFLLQGRRVLSLTLLVIAGMFHPLLAVGGFLIWGGMQTVDWLGWPRAGLVFAMLAGVAGTFLATPWLTERYLGYMDDEWRGMIMKGSPFAFTCEWELHDWLNIISSVVSVAGGIFMFQKAGEPRAVRPRVSEPGVTRGVTALGSPRRAQFCAVALLVGIAAVVGNILADNLPYALLLQGQPFRSLWILKVLQVPLCIVLIDRLWRSGAVAQQALALVVFAFLVGSGVYPLEWLLTLVNLPLCLVMCWGGLGDRRRSNAVMSGIALAIVLGQFVWMTYRQYLCTVGREELLRHLDLFELIKIQRELFGILPTMVVIAGAVLWLMGRAEGREAPGCAAPTNPGPYGPWLAMASIAVFVACQGFYFAAANSEQMREQSCCHVRDIFYARDFLQTQHVPGQELPTVYCAYGKVEYVWLDFRTNNYFDWSEAGGFLFQRRTAVEGQRRALLISPFEVARFQEFKEFINPRLHRQMKSFYRRDVDAPAPTALELAQLCADPELDFAVLKQGFPGLYSASNGRVFIYDCRKVRAAFNHVPSPHEIAASDKSTIAN